MYVCMYVYVSDYCGALSYIPSYRLFCTKLVHVSTSSMQYNMHASNTRGSHKVPGIVVQHCNGRTYDNACLITFKVRPLRTHTLAPPILPFLDTLAEGFFWNLPEFSRRIRFYVLHGAKRVPLRNIFRIGNSRKSRGARSREYGGWVMKGMLFSARNCCTTSDVWLGASS